MAERDRCALVAEVLPEVATGAATGADRARVLRHLAGCARCRRELEELARVADDLLPLVPEREPPAGFEAEVLGRLTPAADGGGLVPVLAGVLRGRGGRPAGARAGRWRRLAVAGLAAALAAMFGAGLVWWRTAPDRHLAAEYRHTLAVGEGSYLVAAEITTASGEVAGHLYAYEGRPSWVYVTVTAAPVPGRYQVLLAAKDGRQWILGECVALRQYCGSGATIAIGVRDVSAVRLDQPGGPSMVAQLS